MSVCATRSLSGSGQRVVQVAFEPGFRMLAPQRLEQVLALHEKSYALLRWVKGALRQGHLSFSTLHTSTDSTAAAEEWIRRHLTNIPVEARPKPDDMTAFSRLFAAFLVTSF